MLQIEFVGAVPKSSDDASLAVAKRVFTTIDEACGVPYVAPAECGAISTPACRAFRAP